MLYTIAKSKGCDLRTDIIEWSKIIREIRTILCVPYYRSERGATRESPRFNARNALGNGDGGKGGTIRKGTIHNPRDAVRDSNRSEGGTTIKSKTSNARDAIWDSNRSEGGAIVESKISNTRYAIRDYCIVTTYNQGICRCFYNRIAIITAIIF